MTRLMSSFKLLLLIIAFSAISKVHSTTLLEIFEKNLNPVFITVNNGAGQEGIHDALLAGFPQIFVAEVSQYTFEADFILFGSYPNVHLLLGNPAAILTQIVTNLNQRATIWFGAPISPSIIAELNSIAMSPIKDNAIIIDHINQYSQQDQKQILKIINGINPHYRISYEHIHPHNRVLIATVHKHGHGHGHGH